MIAIDSVGGFIMTVRGIAQTVAGYARQSLPALALAVLVGSGMADGVAAQTLSIECKATESSFPAMTLVYEGAAEGTLTIASSLGEMALPATRAERTGEAGSVVGIRAFGEASILMPERTSIEACLEKRADRDAGDADLIMMSIDSCRREAPLGASPVAITANFEVATLGSPDAYVYFTFSYVDKSSVPGDHISIESLPPPHCTVTEAQ
jgi:hypothetical protein